MKLFKNGVGRPSNETKQLRKVFVVSVSAIVISVVALLVSLITNTNINSGGLEGAASDSKNTLGDVCGTRVNTGPDGKVDLIDALCILNFSAKLQTPTTIQKKNADFNGDGKITSNDASKVLKNLKSKYKKGDYDFDGYITSNDAYAILQYSSNNTAYSENLKSIYDYFADFNGDGKITANDAKKVLDSGILMGDANGDGKVSKTDAKCMLAYHLGFHNKNKDFCGVKIKKGSENWIAADINGDGDVTSTDAAVVFGMLSDGYMWGDTNGDGTLTEEDAVKLLKLSSNHSGDIKKGDEAYKIYLDLNFDNIISASDARILLNILKVEKGKYGDLNNDGKLNRKDAKKYAQALYNAKFKTSNVTKNADVNKDLAVNNNDMYLLLAIDIARHGDINRDGEITSADSRVLLRYLEGKTTKDNDGQTIKVNKSNADLNYDNSIDDDDLALLQRYVQLNISK